MKRDEWTNGNQAKWEYGHDLLNRYKYYVNLDLHCIFFSFLHISKHKRSNNLFVRFFVWNVFFFFKQFSTTNLYRVSIPAHTFCILAHSQNSIVAIFNRLFFFSWSYFAGFIFRQNKSKSKNNKQSNFAFFA